MPPEIHVTSHVHVDGPIPGPHSLLTIASAAYTRDGRLISTFVANLRELAGANPHPISLQDWRDRAEEWLNTRRASRPPAHAIADHARWVSTLPGRPTLLTDPTQPDYLFLYWYLQHFAGYWPYAEMRADVGRIQRLRSTAFCPLASCHQQLPRTA